jgi:hypothetical protein
MACPCCGCPDPYPDELLIQFGQQTYSRPDNCIIAQQTTDLFSNATYVLARSPGETSCTQTSYGFTNEYLGILVVVNGDFLKIIQISSSITSSACAGSPVFAETYGFFSGQNFYNVRTNVNTNPQRYPFFANLSVDAVPFFTFSR